MTKKVFGNDINITKNGSFKNLTPPTQKDGKFIEFVFNVGVIFFHSCLIDSWSLWRFI